jgi:hypothetical protein
MRSALEALGNVTNSHEQRFLRAQEDYRHGKSLLSDVAKAVETLRNDIGFLEVLCTNRQITRCYPGTDILCLRARYSWMSCLPETSKLLLAGRSPRQIWESLIWPEDGFEDDE